MDIQKELLLWVGAALVCAMVVSFIMCPLVKSFAYKIGAIDVPKDSRRMHKKPVPRLGGLAIFLGRCFHGESSLLYSLIKRSFLYIRTLSALVKM